MPWEFLADSEARGQDPIQLEAVGDGCVVARWREGGIPQMVRYAAVARRRECPSILGEATARARSSDQAPPAELVLSGSKASGWPIRIHTDRGFLAWAVRLGFEEYHLFGPRLPVLCRDKDRRYVWALLDPDSARMWFGGLCRFELPAPLPTTSSSAENTGSILSPPHGGTSHVRTKAEAALAHQVRRRRGLRWHVVSGE